MKKLKEFTLKERLGVLINGLLIFVGISLLSMFIFLLWVSFK